MMKKLLCALLVMAVALAQGAAAVVTDTIVIERGERRIFGILGRPAGSEGERLPLAVIAHGFNGNHEWGVNYMEPLARAGYQCYTLDFPCGGMTSRYDNNTMDMSIADQRDDLLAVVGYFAARPDTDPGRISLIGESQGGLVSALAAAEVPGRLDKLVMVFAALGIPDNYNKAFPDDEAVPDTTRIWNVPLGRRFFSEMRDMDAWGALRACRLPVLLVHGESDKVIPLASSERAHAMLPGSELKVIAGGGHGFGKEDFAKSCGYITEFLNRDETAPQTLEEAFLNPRDNHRPMLIWQWMDGLVSKEGITRDLEAIQEAGLAGVWNFQIGGPYQMRIGNPANDVGNGNWKELLRWTLDECERLGLVFGTHNCPGWSSSAYPTVRPEDSMLKLVYSATPVGGGRAVTLPTPDVDPQWDYYEDVAVLAVPADSVPRLEDIRDVSRYFDRKKGMLKLPRKVKLPPGTVLLRIGQTTIGKTNEGQSPLSGRGLECDKLSRGAVEKFWAGYPSMVLEVAGRHVGKTFIGFEIDSYEAGGQTWSGALPDEFGRRAGYSLVPYLPLMAGYVKCMGNDSITGKFMADWAETVRDCVAENYYGHMTRLARAAGVRMLLEPYGTSGQRPFHIIDFERIVRACGDADIATEFWQSPHWGWKDMYRHGIVARKLQLPVLWAESFTCWPMKAWSDSPATIKPKCDLAFCAGVNRMMLHAGAANPWPGVEPGMSMGAWGTHFVPGQTWWKAGGARELFGYMARCSALLQRGLPATEQLPENKVFKTVRRTEGDTDIILVCNPTDSIVREGLEIRTEGRSTEIWDPYLKTMNACCGDKIRDIEIEPYGSRFVIVRPGGSGKPQLPEVSCLREMPVTGSWSLEFPETGTLETDTLFSWPDSNDKGVKYFSGTAVYRKEIAFPDDIAASSGKRRMVLDLGDVKEMAKVKVNGVTLPVLWKAPYVCDVTDVVRAGVNEVEIEVTNLWPNRMIGDESEPDDMEWSEPLVYDDAPGKPRAGCYLVQEPEWLRNGTPRPSAGRKTVGCFKFFTKDSPLLPSGLLGPVKVKLLQLQ